MASYSYAISNVEMWADIEGMGNVEIVSFSSQFTINAVPAATLTIAAGRDAKGGKSLIKLGGGSSGLGAGNTGTTPTASDILANATQRARVKVYLKLDSGTSFVKLGGGSTFVSEVMLFDGYLAGVSSERTGSTVGVRLNLVHWLDDLRSTSAMTDSRTPAANWDLQHPLTQTTNAGGQPTYSLEGFYVTNKAILTQDVGELMGQVARSLANGMVLGRGDSANALKNPTAIAALNKIFGILKMSVNFTEGVKSGLARMISNAFYSTYGGGNMWESFLRLTTPLLFTIAPGVKQTFFIPYTPVLNNVTKSLADDDYVYINRTAVVRRLIRALILYDRDSSQAGNDVTYQTPVSVYYVNDDAAGGLIDAAPVPGWLRDTAYLDNAEKTYLASTGLGIRGRGPAIDYGEDGSKSMTAQRNKEAPDLKETGTAYAQQLFVSRMFGQNAATVQTPLRFDIGPGTNVLLSNTSVGYVTSVGVNVDSERANASCTLGLSHVRGLSDNLKYGLAKSPLYKQYAKFLNWTE